MFIFKLIFMRMWKEILNRLFYAYDPLKFIISLFLSDLEHLSCCAHRIEINFRNFHFKFSFSYAIKFSGTANAGKMQ